MGRVGPGVVPTHTLSHLVWRRVTLSVGNACALIEYRVHERDARTSNDMPLRRKQGIYKRCSAENAVWTEAIHQHRDYD